MKNNNTTTTDSVAATTSWDTLEHFARHQIQSWIQQLLEEEVTSLLGGRDRYERRQDVDPEPGYRNGYGKPRRVSMSCGTITVRRPRVRGLDERFESRILPLFKRRTQQVAPRDGGPVDGDGGPVGVRRTVRWSASSVAVRGVVGDLVGEAAKALHGYRSDLGPRPGVKEDCVGRAGIVGVVERISRQLEVSAPGAVAGDEEAVLTLL